MPEASETPRKGPRNGKGILALLVRSPTIKELTNELINQSILLMNQIINELFPLLCPYLMVSIWMIAHFLQFNCNEIAMTLPFVAIDDNIIGKNI